ncbi:RidA family protein [Maridesulfovibrio hydrothermalis]|uniref:Aminoacrylate/iminopropionate hydrolase/deaminase n=1 Tax=Maridesulfovibrio hydrothermalis AM13 = DSM 14728 TaxID=1121451 RepID=L0RDM9_9BACT|nr:RidA family protein [Maridesulfovibrio hydrothermalis]CCO24327.1 aminoacrylate/iminopropionate hydrolase/deaminase [Maridesulfovibrio hydrothermalis AM13 = DSM 14728]
MIVTTVNTENAPAAIGPYSQATIYNGQAFVSGQLGLSPKTGEFVSEDVEAQTRQALVNLKAILEACGSSLNKVISVDVFLTSMEDFATVNNVYAEYFSSHKPARAAIEVSALPKGGLVEIKCIAAI